MSRASPAWRPMGTRAASNEPSIRPPGAQARAVHGRLAGVFDRLADPRAYPWFGALLVLYNLAGGSFLHNWGPVDYWEHLAAIDALARDPMRPVAPYFASAQSSHLFTPYHLAWALVAKLTTLRGHVLASLMAAVNTILFLTGARALARRLTGDPRPALWFVLTLLFFWLRPWRWSGFYDFGLLPLTAAYPYWFAFSMTLLMLGRTGAGAGTLAEAVLIASGVALVFLTHPLTGSFLAVALAVRGLSQRGTARGARWAALVAPAAGLVAALAWPYFPVAGAMAGAPRFADLSFAGDWVSFYDKFPLRLLPAGLGAVYFVRAIRTRTWDWVGWTLLVVSAIYVLNPVSVRSAFLSRYVIFLAFMLHCGIVRALSLSLGWGTDRSAMNPRLARAILAGYLLVLAPAAALELRTSTGWLGTPWANLPPSPAGDRDVREFMRRFAAYAAFVGPSDVIMAGMTESYVLPAVLGGHVVGVPHGSPFLHDATARREAVSRFFDPHTTADERRDLLDDYAVTRVLVPRADAPRLAGLETPRTRILFADDYYELRAVVGAGRGDAPRGRAP